MEDRLKMVETGYNQLKLVVIGYNQSNDLVEKLRIYNTALILVKEIYSLINSNVILRKDFSLNDQLKRATISVVLNIAEGNGRSKKLFQNYLKIAVGSTNETIACLQIINTVYLINTTQLQHKYTILAKQITAFSNTF